MLNWYAKFDVNSTFKESLFELHSDTKIQMFVCDTYKNISWNLLSEILGNSKNEWKFDITKWL